LTMWSKLNPSVPFIRSANQRRAAAGISLALMVLMSSYAGFHPGILSFKDIWPSGIFGCLAALLLLPDANIAQRIQLGLLLLIGIVLLVVGISKGAVVNWSGLLSQNTGLLTMVLTVGLLKLVITSGSVADQKLPVGRKAYLHTLLSLSVFSSVINISAPILVADRLSLNRPLDYFSAATIVRIFSSCSSWSPFFAGTAVVLTAVHGIHLPSIMLNGLPLMLSAIVVLYLSASWFNPDKLSSFHGYPIQIESLWVPATLGAMVFSTNRFFPTIPILTVIAVSAITLTFVVLMSRRGLNNASQRLRNYVTEDFPKSVNEVQLFITAGILASGLQALVQVGTLSAPIEQFTALGACLLLALIIFIAALGIHPVIQIAASTPLILVVNPDPELLGLTYMFGWSLGTCGSPLSGTNLVMQGRYGIVAWRGAVQNWPFIGFMYIIACVLLLIRGWLG